jgi:hypothetical protein
MANADRSRGRATGAASRPAAAASRRQDGPETATARRGEDDVTEPDIEVPDADRAEQEALVDPPAVVSAADVDPPPEDVPEADAIDQQLDALPKMVDDPKAVGDREASEADVLEQETGVRVDEDDVLS